MNTAIQLDWKRRIIGVLPISFFFVSSIDSIMAGKSGEILWLCTVCNATLGLGILFASPTTVWTSVLWIMIGTPLCIMDEWAQRIFHPIAFCTHILSSVIGYYALRWIPKREQCVWGIGILGLIFLQMASRCLTKSELNVNLSFAVYKPLERIFGSYWIYWVLNLVVFSFLLNRLERKLEKLSLVRFPMAARSAA